MNAATTDNYIRLTSNIESGVSPLDVTLRIDGSFSVEDSSLSVTGPGPVEFRPGTEVDEYQVSMTAEGVYYFIAESTGPDGKVYQDTIAITVMNKAQLDALLKAKWMEMKGALTAQDIDGALAFFADESKQHYNDIFSALNSQLPQLTQEMQDIQMITATGADAKYRIRKNELYNGQMLSITYYVYFGIDKDGVWKIIWY